MRLCQRPRVLRSSAAGGWRSAQGRRLRARGGREGLFGGLLVQSLGSLGFHDPSIGGHCYEVYEDVNEGSSLRWVMLWDSLVKD